MLVCGPSFGSGRYGYACGTLAREAARRGIPAVCGMHPESPGVLAAEGAAYIVPTDDKVTGMRDALPRMAALARRLAAGEPLGSARAGGLSAARPAPQRDRATSTGAERAVDLLLAKLAGDVRDRGRRRRFDDVPPPPPVTDMAAATVALVTESGLVPKGNPDRLESNRAHAWLSYPLEGVAGFEAARLGDGARRLRHQRRQRRPEPARAARRRARAGSTRAASAGFTRRSTRRPATRPRWRRRPSSAQEIAQRLREAGVQAVILTGT